MSCKSFVGNLKPFQLFFGCKFPDLRTEDDDAAAGDDDDDVKQAAKFIGRHFSFYGLVHIDVINCCGVLGLAK